MPESVPLHCPACRREHVYTAPPYPCACGAPGAPRLDPAAEPAVLAHRAWDEDWVTVRCTACGRRNQWPHPELGCPCGTVLRIPVAGAPSPGPGHRPAARSAAVASALDAVTAAVLCLRRLGHRDIRRADQRPPSGIGLAAPGLVVLVDPAVRPASPRDVECLWLTAMTESAHCVCFSVSGYSEAARVRADALAVPLFTLGHGGTATPVNGPGRLLAGPGAGPDLRTPRRQAP
ncbi:hypothetical protein ACIRU2_21385 [Streptomyces sp. NPDC101169]|uniref:hypothetical protein n=1 Tax=Streptomyces sp. NPDC101169 TaxID=3366121 RepID=UPI0037FC2A4B